MNVKITVQCLAILSQRPAKIQMAVISAFVYRALEKKAAHVKVRVFHVDGVYAMNYFFYYTFVSLFFVK